MPTFDYVAVGTSGKKEKGVIAADSARAARKELRIRQLTPLKLGEAREKKTTRLTRFQSNPVSQTDLLLITRQWAMMISSGTPVEETIQASAVQAEKPGMRKVLLSIRTSVTEGYKLSESLSSHPRVFNSLYRSIVSAGEASGELGSVLERLAEYLERSRKVRQTILAAVIYPAVLACTALTVMIGLMTFVVPKVVEQFTSMEQELPALTKAVIGVSDFLRNYGLIVLIGLFPAFWALSRLFKDRHIKRGTDRFLLKLPVIGNMLRQMNVILANVLPFKRECL